jgi:hypothetical protein
MTSTTRALALGFLLLSPFAMPEGRAESFCVPGPGDVPETTLQGGLTTEKRNGPIGPNGPMGFQGEQCGMRQVGHNRLAVDRPDLNPPQTNVDRGSFGDVQIFGHCAYASMRDPSNLNLPTTGTAVLDVRVPSNPIWLRTLRTLAMQRAYSALEIQKNIMIGAFKDFGPNGDNWFDIYDVSGDCLNPKPLAVNTAESILTRKITTTGGNHDGWLTPDTNTYYGIPFGGVRILSGTADAPVLNPARIDMHVLDMSDPANPKHLLNWNRLQLPADVQPRVLATTNFHDVSSNQDGTRVYLALYGGNNSLGGNNNNPIPAQNQRCSNGLLILDSSEVQARVPNPQLKYVSLLSWCDQQIDPDYGDGSTASAHATEYVIHENGKPYIVSTDESGAGLNGEWNQHIFQRTFSRLIDVSDERNPRVVSTFKPDVNDPDNVLQVAKEQINGGMLHYIGFANRNNMRLVFFAAANQGIRVVDWRDPERPKEIAYYKAPNSQSTRVGENDFTRPDPRYDPAACLIYTGWNQGGLRILELTNPEYNECMRREAKGDGWVAGKGKAHFHVDARRNGGGIEGGVDLKEQASKTSIEITSLSFLGGVRDACGDILPTANAVQLNGTGTFNGAPASFRVCVQDNRKGEAKQADRFHIVCTAGCSYSASGELGGGRVEVTQH